MQDNRKPIGRQHAFASEHQARYPVGYPRRPPGGGGHRASVSRRVSATGIRFSVILFPPGSWPSLRSAYRTRPSARTPTGFPCSARVSRDRGGCPLYPGDGGALPGQVASLTGACRSSAASPCTPLRHPIAPGSACRSINEGSSNPPVRPFPSPVAARMERAALGLSPGLRTPPTRSRRRTPRWGQAIEARTWNYSLNIYIWLILQSVVHSQRATSRRTATRGSQEPPDETAAAAMNAATSIAAIQKSRWTSRERPPPTSADCSICDGAVTSPAIATLPPCG